MDQRHIQRAWETFITDGVAPAVVSKHVVASWQRSREHAVGIYSTMAPLAQEAEIYRHRSECCALVNAARPVFSRSAPMLSGADAMLILTDTTGMVLETQGDERVIEEGRAIHLEHGGRWREADIGTNAIGTAVATARPVQIHGAEHFCSEIQKWTCAAAPVRHPFDHEILGVVDISGPADKFIPQSLAFAVSISHHIEDILARSIAADRERLLQRSLQTASQWTDDEFVVIDRRGAIVHASERALRTLERARPDVVVDTGIPMLRGLPTAQWQSTLSALFPNAAVEMMKDETALVGAIVVLRSRRPASTERIRATGVRGRLAARQTRAESAEARQTPARRLAGSGMIAEDPTLRGIVEKVELAAARTMPILILGETGTGKEQLARHAHAASGRPGAFVPVNCAALPDSLAEAELFGYADGAFTGARRGGATGLVKEADGGTLFLDEIGDMPMTLQAVLLRFLDDWTVRPIGGASSKVDIFLISATNVGLEKAIAEGRFRADLMYRLNTLEVTLPRLAERKDFGTITRHLLATIDPACTITPRAAERLAARSWPGNIRQLRNILTRYTLTAEGKVIDEATIGGAEVASVTPDAAASPAPMPETERAPEHARILAAYEEARGNVSRVARQLSLSRNTVYRALEQAGLHKRGA